MQSTRERSNPEADRTEADEKKSLEEKLWSSPLFWVSMVLALSLIGAAIAVGTYFILVDGAKTNDTDGSESGSDTDETVPVEKICRPTNSNIKWVKDVDMLYDIGDGESYKLSIYSGAATYDEMQRICSRLVRRPEQPIKDGAYSYTIRTPEKKNFPMALFCPKLSQYQWIANISWQVSFVSPDMETWKVNQFNYTRKYEEMQQVCDTVDGKMAPESYIYLPSAKNTIDMSLFCADVTQHKWIADVTKIKTSPDGMNWQEESFNGAGMYKDMTILCTQLLRYPFLSYGKNTIRPTSQREEEAIDQIVRKNKDLIFGNMPEDVKGLLWTGYYFHNPSDRYDWWKDSFDPSISYQQSCYPNNFVEDIETFRKSPNRFIFVAKDYRVAEEDHACWQLLPRISNVDNVEKEEEIYPTRLPFVCKSRKSDLSGAFGLPGSSWDVLKVKSIVKPGWEYLLSPFRATFSEAEAECRSLNSTLVSLKHKDLSKHDEVIKLIENTTDFRSLSWFLFEAFGVDITYNIWSGHFIDLLSENPEFDTFGDEDLELIKVYKELSTKAKSIRKRERCNESRWIIHGYFKQTHTKKGTPKYEIKHVHSFDTRTIFDPKIEEESYIICERIIQ